MITSYYYFILIVLMGGLSSCGFHLRGLGVANNFCFLQKTIIINNTGDKNLANAIEIERQKVINETLPISCCYKLVLKDLELTKRVTSVSASTIPRQYQLTLQVGYLLKDPSNKIIVPLSLISTSRQLTVTNNRILGSNLEEERIIEQMKREVAFKILNQIYYYKFHKECL